MSTSHNRGTIRIALISVLAALHIILSIPPGPVGFRRLSIIIEPLEGIIGGSVFGFSAALIGWLGGRIIRPEAFYFENFFGIAEAIGAMGAGLLVARKWWLVSMMYGGFLAAFLISPFARQVPLWTLWDTYLGFLAIFPTGILLRTPLKEAKGRLLVLMVAFITFIAVELDAMVRIFMLADLGLYQLYGLPNSAWSTIFIAGAFQTPIETVYSVALMIVAGVPVLIALKESKILDWPIS